MSSVLKARGYFSYFSDLAKPRLLKDIQARRNVSFEKSCFLRPHCPVLKPWSGLPGSPTTFPTNGIGHCVLSRSSRARVTSASSTSSPSTPSLTRSTPVSDSCSRRGTGRIPGLTTSWPRHRSSSDSPSQQPSSSTPSSGEWTLQHLSQLTSSMSRTSQVITVFILREYHNL